MIICAYEDRAAALPGLKLLILSVARYLPDVTVDLTCPKIAGQVADWASQVGVKNLRLRETRDWEGVKWSVKGPKMLELFDEGHEEVVWIDTDVIVHKDFRPAFAAAPADSMILSQEFRASRPGFTQVRTEGWGYEFARDLPYPLNGGVIRALSSHRRFLERWVESMKTPEYLRNEALPVMERDPIYLADQDAMTALLGSKEFADLPLHFLLCGEGIIQNSGSNGYHAVDRLKNTFRDLPPLIHMLGREKPWDYTEVPPFSTNRRDYLALVNLELGPYTHVARRFAAEMREPTPWLEFRTVPGRLLHWGFLGHPSLQGVIPALAACLKPGRLGT